MKTLFKSFLLLLMLAAALPVSAQDYCMTSPAGYGRNAAGGGGGKIVPVGTRAELKSALKASEPSVIIVTRNITFGAGQMINETITDKTLLGLPGVKLITTERSADGGILGLKKGSKNVIIRNLIFEGPGAYDVDGKDLISNNGCTDFWVDHCEFYDGVDGNFDNTNYADDITISWCRFGYKIPPLAGGSGGSNDHRFSNLVGGSSGNAPQDGHYSITFQYCWWGDGCRQRMPRARNAELHILNCYYSSNVPDALAIGLGAGSNGTTCYVEGTDFKKVKRVVDTSYDPAAGKTAAVYFTGCLGGGSSSGTVPKPSYPYTALDADKVEAVVTGACGAGATLHVTLAGEISSPCASGLLPAVPANVHAVSEADAVTVGWDAVEDAAGYRVKLCSTDETSGSGSIIKEWNFAGPWTINAGDADDNLILDGGSRFNYKPAVNSEELVFAGGGKIPDTEGLKFTAGADKSLRLGFNTGLLYLNGRGIKVEIPCSPGDYITIEGLSSNAAETNRGFSAAGASVDHAGTSANITDGILTEAGGRGVWSFIASGSSVIISTVTNGMNISRITVSSNPAYPVPVCREYEVDAPRTSLKVEELRGNSEYTYQVKSIKDGRESAYSTAQTITTGNPAAARTPEAENEWDLFWNNGRIAVTGAEAAEIRLYTAEGIKILAVFNSNTIDAGRLSSGVYLVEVLMENGTAGTRKIIIP